MDIINDVYCNEMVNEAVPMIAKMEIENEKNRQEKEELEHGFMEWVDRVILENSVEVMARLYEE